MKIIKRLTDKLKNWFVSLKLISKSYIQILMKSSDYSRWRNKESLQYSWDERTIIMAKEIPPNSIVFEFGAGRRILKDHLPKNCIYNHSDIVKRDENTIIIDLNKKKLPNIEFNDFIVFSGVLEYIHHIDKVFEHYSPFTNNFLFSYACLEEFSKLKFRRSQGWASDYSLKDFLKLSKRINFKCKKIETWKNQKLVHLSRKK